MNVTQNTSVIDADLTISVPAGLLTTEQIGAITGGLSDALGNAVGAVIAAECGPEVESIDDLPGLSVTLNVEATYGGTVTGVEPA